MNCPHCHHADTRVVDSRETEGGLAVRRRRVCEACEQRFTTYERIEALVPVTVSPRTGQAMQRGRALSSRRGAVPRVVPVPSAVVSPRFVELDEPAASPHPTAEASA